MEITSTGLADFGLTGRLFTPVTGSCPGVLLVGGSGGGRHDRDTELLAAEGFVVLLLCAWAWDRTVDFLRGQAG